MKHRVKHWYCNEHGLTIPIGLPCKKCENVEFLAQLRAKAKSFNMKPKFKVGTRVRLDGELGTVVEIINLNPFPSKAKVQLDNGKIVNVVEIQKK